VENKKRESYSAQHKQEKFINERLDISYLLNSYVDIDKVKFLLFSEKQRMSFEGLKVPSVFPESQIGKQYFNYVLSNNKKELFSEEPEKIAETDFLSKRMQEIRKAF